MHGKDYWNFITHNAYRVTSSCTFCRCCAGAVFSDIGLIFQLFNDGFWNTGYMPCLGVNLHLELKNAATNSQKTGSSQIYDLKSAGDQMVSLQYF